MNHGGSFTSKAFQLVLLCIFVGVIADVAVDLARALAPYIIAGALAIGLCSLIYNRLRRW